MMIHHVSDAMSHTSIVETLEQARRLERILKVRANVDTGTRERLRTLLRWEGEKRIRLYGIDYGDSSDIETMDEETKKLAWVNTSGCWIKGAPLVIFQEHKYVFPSERIFAEIALALAAGVGQNG